MSAPQDPHWLEKPATINKLVWTLYTVCGLLLLSELFYHRHTHFDFEGWFGFYGFYGFGAYLFIVLSAKGLRRILRRDTDYYTAEEEARAKNAATNKEPHS